MGAFLRSVVVFHHSPQSVANLDRPPALCFLYLLHPLCPHQFRFPPIFLPEPRRFLLDDLRISLNAFLSIFVPVTESRLRHLALAVGEIYYCDGKIVFLAVTCFFGFGLIASSDTLSESSNPARSDGAVFVRLPSRCPVGFNPIATDGALRSSRKVMN